MEQKNKLFPYIPLGEYCEKYLSKIIQRKKYHDINYYYLSYRIKYIMFQLIYSGSAVEDFELTYDVEHWCKENGFEVISYEGDGSDGGYEPKFRRSW